MDLREEILKILNSEVSELKEGSDGDYQQVKAIDECDFNDVSERLIKLFSLHRVSKCDCTTPWTHADIETNELWCKKCFSKL